MSAHERVRRAGLVGVAHQAGLPGFARRSGLLGLAVLAMCAGSLALAAGSAMAAAAVSTGPPSGVGLSSATLEGVVNPEGEEIVLCEFEYGETGAFGHTAPCEPAAPGSGSSPVAVSAKVSGLTAGTTYEYRLVAAGLVAGLSFGGVEAFSTLPAVSGVQTEPASGVELSGRSVIATLNGSLAPDGTDAHYYFEYGETEAYGSVSPAPPGTDAGEAFKSEHAQTDLAGLKPYAVYHYRLVASNSFGTVRGADMTFDTAGLAAPPIVGGLPASGVSQFAGTLNGTLQTGEALVNYHFEYGTTTAYGSVAPIPDNYTPITTETVTVSQPVNGLQAGTTYHYRLLASSPGGTNVAGPDETFTTLPIPTPTAATGAAQGVGVGAATLNGTVDPQGWDTSYLFEYGTSTTYGQSWPTVQVDMGALEGAQPVVVNVTGLLPSTTYHYRLQASNGGGTSYGPDMTFTTGEYPAQIIQEPAATRTLLVPSGPGKITTSAPKKKKSGKKVKKRRTKSHSHAKRNKGGKGKRKG